MNRYSLLPLLFVLPSLAFGSEPVENNTLQFVAFNRLARAFADSMLPLSFDIPKDESATQLQGRLVDVEYCGGNSEGNAKALAIALPADGTLPRKGLEADDCSKMNLDDIKSRIQSLPFSPDWFAVVIIEARSKDGNVSLTFKDSRIVAKHGLAISNDVTSLFQNREKSFFNVSLKNSKISIQDKAIVLNIVPVFKESTIVFYGFMADEMIPKTLPFPSDIELTSQPDNANSVLRISHKRAKELLEGAFPNFTFPLSPLGRSFVVSKLRVIGDVDQYQTSGTIGISGQETGLSINWTGQDLGFESLQLAEAEVQCASLDLRCHARKKVFETAQDLLNKFTHKGGHLRLDSGHRLATFQVGNKTYKLTMYGRRTTSTKESLQLSGFLTIDWEAK